MAVSPSSTSTQYCAGTTFTPFGVENLKSFSPTSAGQSPGVAAIKSRPIIVAMLDARRRVTLRVDLDVQQVKIGTEVPARIAMVIPMRANRDDEPPRQRLAPATGPNA